MAEIQGPKLILVLTVVFVIGTFVFIVIFRALSTFQDLQVTVLKTGNYTENQSTLETLKVIPWYLGGLYVTLLGIIIYFMIAKNKEELRPPEIKRY